MKNCLKHLVYHVHVINTQKLDLKKNFYTKTLSKTKTKKRHKEEKNIERYIPGFFLHFRMCHIRGPKGCVTYRTQVNFMKFAFQV